MNYFVINADIKNSRKHKFKKDHFKTQINQLNSDFKENLVVPFSLLVGDGLQGVVSESCQIFQLIRKIKYSFLPFDIRIGIGYGMVEDEEQLKQIKSSWELNGEAFYKARDAMDVMKEKKGKKEFVYDVYLITGNDLLDHRVNLMYTYVLDHLDKWKKDVWDIILLEEQGYKHEEIAKEMIRLTQINILDEQDLIKKERINVTRKIQRAHWYRVKETEIMLNKWLKEGLNL